MKQTPSAIIVLAATILGAGAVLSLSNGNENITAFLALLAMPMGIVGLISLIRVCLHDYEMSVGVAHRLEFLEELVHLERLSLARKERLCSQVYTDARPGATKPYEDTRKKVAA